MSYDGEYDASEYPEGINGPRLGYRGAREMAEKDRQIEALRADNDRLRIELEQAQLRSIEWGGRQNAVGVLGRLRCRYRSTGYNQRCVLEGSHRGAHFFQSGTREIDD